MVKRQGSGQKVEMTRGSLSQCVSMRTGSLGGGAVQVCGLNTQTMTWRSV